MKKVLSLSLFLLLITNCSKDTDFDNNSGQENTSGYVYVDLGLPSGTLWATKNVGADTPEDFGDYFAWGETEGYNSGKTTFDISTYKYLKGNIDLLTKYCNNSEFGYKGFCDELIELEPIDDAAYVNWGSDWRMPTVSQWKELIQNCTWSWNGQYLYWVKGKNGNSIILPVAGYRYDNSLGGSGHYWSSSLDTNIPRNAYCVFFAGGHVQYELTSRYCGLSVRPVRSK